MADIAQPHDRFFKALMASPNAANALIRERLPRRLVEELADAPPEPVGTELIDARLQSSSADGLFRASARSEGEAHPAQAQFQLTPGAPRCPEIRVEEVEAAL
jgi:hypothetical protein